MPNNSAASTNGPPPPIEGKNPGDSREEMQQIRINSSSGSSLTALQHDAPAQASPANISKTQERCSLL
jgi:hypothetical protein